MNSELTEDQRIFYESTRKFALNELADGAVARAQKGEYPWDVAKKLAKAGLLGLTLSTDDGGAGGTLTDALIAIRAITEVCPRSGDVVQAGNFGAIRTFAEFATKRQKERLLPRLLKGEDVMAVGMTEPEAGSAVTELSTTATEYDDGYLITGTKIFGTHSHEASLFLIYVRFGPGGGGIGSVIIERGTPGFHIGKPSKFMNGEQWSELHFDNCKIPDENVLLGAGGLKKQLSGFNIERLGNAARSLAVGTHAFNIAKTYAVQRKQFGRALCEFQGLQWKFAEVSLRLEAAGLLLMRAAARAVNGLPTRYDTAMAKLACNEAGFLAANEALQILGGHGFSEDSIVQYCVRKTRGWMIAGGSSEILKNIIAEDIFNRRFPQYPVTPSVSDKFRS